MDFNKLTIKSGEAVAAAQELARRLGNPELTPDHLTVALLEQDLPRTLLQRAGADPASVRAEAEARLGQQPAVSGQQQAPQAGAAFRKALDRAFEEARQLGDEFVSVEHLLLALDLVPREALLEALEDVRGGQRVTSQDPEGSYQALEKYGRDLTALAEAGKLDPVIGRDEEIRRVIQVLSRRTKNNPVLIGEPGVGKTAIAEGLAQRIVAGDVPEGLKGKRVWALDVGALHRRREVPRRVRGAPQGGAARDHRSGGRDHPLHRRAAHDRRRRRRRGRGLRGEHAEADARPRRAARGRRDDARRVPQAHREGRRRSSGASSRCSSASPRSPTRSRSCAGSRSATRRTTVSASATRRSSPRRCSPTATSPTASCPTRRSTSSTRRASRLRMEIDSSPVELDEAERRVRQLEIELAAMAKETDAVREPVERRARGGEGAP